MKILVTHATSMIGRVVVHDLAMRGHDVRAVSHASSWPSSWPRDVERVTADATQWVELDQAIRGVDRIVHVGPRLGQPLSEVAGHARKTALAIRDLADTYRVGHITTLGTFGLAADRGDASAHRYAVWEAADILRSGSVPVTELRTGPVLAAGGAVTELLVAAASIPVRWWTLWGKNIMQPVNVYDLAEAIAFVVREGSPPVGDYAVGISERMSVNDLIERVRKLSGGRSAIHLPTLLPPEAATLLIAKAAGVSVHRTHALLSSLRQDAVRTTEPWLAGHPITRPLRDTLDAVTSRDAQALSAR